MSTTTPPAGHVAHVAINADDVERARRFYGAVFGWTFEPWGPPGFFHIRTGSGERPGLEAALQARRDLVGGRPTTGFECTVAVDDVDAVTAAVIAGGGTVLMEKTTIAGVGDLVFFADPSGNVCGAMRYDPEAD
ncbi:MAG TPA: VOC family protein [Acidimicrobiales bacterium]|nr:VOC family protein [Acidimicrobiales bacterium]